MRADQPRVVVTGLGATTPLGGDVASTWESLLAGRSGAVRLPDDWTDVPLPVQIAAPAAVDPATVLDRVQARRLDRCEQFAIVAAREAWADAGSPEVDPDRLGIVLASGIGGVASTIAAYDTMNEKGWQRLSPFTVPMLMPNGSAGWIGHRTGRARRGAHPGQRVRVRGRGHRLRHGHDPVRPGRRGAGRRHRSGHHPAERGRVRGHARAVHPQRRARAGVPPVRPGPGRLPARRGGRRGGARIGRARRPARRDRARDRGRGGLLLGRAPHRAARAGRHRAGQGDAADAGRLGPGRRAVRARQRARYVHPGGRRGGGPGHRPGVRQRRRRDRRCRPPSR